MNVTCASIHADGKAASFKSCLCLRRALAIFSLSLRLRRLVDFWSLRLTSLWSSLLKTSSVASLSCWDLRGKLRSLMRSLIQSICPAAGSGCRRSAARGLRAAQPGFVRYYCNPQNVQLGRGHATLATGKNEQAAFRGVRSYQRPGRGPFGSRVAPGEAGGSMICKKLFSCLQESTDNNRSES